MFIENFKGGHIKSDNLAYSDEPSHCFLSYIGFIKENFTCCVCAK